MPGPLDPGNARTEEDDVLLGDAYPELRRKERRRKTGPTGEELQALVEDGRFRTVQPEGMELVFSALLAKGYLGLFVQCVDQLRSHLESQGAENRRWALDGVQVLLDHTDLSLVPYGTLPLLLDCVGRTLFREDQPVLRELELELTARLLGIEAVQGNMDSLQAHFAWMRQEAQARGLDYAERILASNSLSLAPMELFYREGQSVLQDRVLPFFRFAGETGARTLVRLLDEESSRQRRNRILGVLKQLGPLILPAVKEGLVAGSWHLVRNALNLVGDLEEREAFEYVVPCLEHPDVRVVRAALRALLRTGREKSERYLVDLLSRVGPELRPDVLEALGEVGTVLAVPPVARLAAEGEEPTRIRALETLGKLRHPAALPTLEATLQRKGRIFKTTETSALRQAAARALVALDTPEARALLDRTIREETRKPEQEALRRIAEGKG